MNIKVKITWENGTSSVVTMDGEEKLSKNFALKELANVSATDEVKYIITPRSMKFINMVQSMRDKFGSIKVNSNYRTTAFNKKVGGDAKSRHLYAEALDWKIPKLGSTKYNEIADAWECLCIHYGEYGAINRYTNGVHLEIGSDKSYGTYIFKERNYVGTSSDW